MALPDNLAQNKADFSRKLIKWYEQNQRTFPWRETTDAYKVLLAEKLLQQTKARQSVVDVYESLIDAYPTPKDLAEANLEVLQLIVQPLGLVYRAKELKSLASEIAEIHEHKVPSDLITLKQLTGIGEYCARAVTCFAYGERVGVVDTNVARWLHRICGIEKVLPANPARKKYLYELVDEVLPLTNVREFNLAILDLCALVCKPRNPKCKDCPVQEYCIYGQRTAMS